MSAVVTELLILLSLSARRAWIEIVCEMRCFCVCVVALRKESVDRNRLFIIGQYLVSVALRKESVDRNRTPHHMNTRPIPSLSARRAWIEILNRSSNFWIYASLSARRAWIEIGVLDFGPGEVLSLSARRAWIEISGPLNAACIWVVALRKESVDRNHALGILGWRLWRRSPQGERG